MNADATERGGEAAVVATTPERATQRRPSLDERRQLVTASLRVGNPANNAKPLPTQADPRHDCQIELAVDEICPYEHNPRRASNAKFAEIKESIRSCGIRNPITVTRRPGEGHFIIEAGGNTRLLAIQELWAETRDARFQKLTALFRPWRSESHVLTAHLIENEQRGEMTFWDKAYGTVALKAQLEAEKKRALTLRQLEEELRSIGMSVSTATLAHYLFATDRLRILGEAVTGLSGLDVRTIQPRLNLLKRYAQMRASLAEAALYAAVFEPVFKRCVDETRQSQPFSAKAVCQACEEALAQYLDEPVTQLRMMLDTLARSSSASLETLTADAGGNRPVLSAESVPTTGSHAPQQATSTRTASTATTGVASSATRVDAMEPFTEQVRLFATLAGVVECLSLDVNAPRGYVMQALPVPADWSPPHPLKRRAWGLLALISGQLRNYACASLPERRGIGDSESHAEEQCGESKATSLIDIDDDFLNWLLDSRDEAAGAFCRIVARVRELPTAAPGFRAITAPLPQPETE